MGLPPELFSFLKELRENNNSEWFDANRKRYEKELKKPFAAFVSDMIGRIHLDDPSIQIEAKDAIFRINRDTRFSKDKTPYKTNVYANISPYGTKSKRYPGFYMSFSADQVYVGGGAYMLEPADILRVRTYIANHLDQFESLLSNKDFVTHFGELQGERSKTVPPELKEAAARQPLLYGKQFFYMSEVDPALATREDLSDRLMERYHAGKPINQFLRNALTAP
jgi:uncharacterized protein (TIGR02453 family)